MRKRKFSIWPYLLVAPALLIVVLVVFVPVLEAIGISFQQYDLRFPKDIAFNNFENYKMLFKDKFFWNALFKTFLWVFFGVGFQLIFGFILALLLNTKFHGRGIFRALSLVPWVTPGILIGLMWRWMYDGNYGVVNDLLSRFFGTEKAITFLANADTAFPSVIVTLVWQGISFFALMILAGLQGVNQELYEAADIDGAGKIKKLLYVTIPSIRNSLLVSTMLRIIWVANSLDILYGMTEGGPGAVTQTLSIYIYKEAISLDLGYGSAMALTMTLLLALVAIPYVIITFKYQEE